MSFFEKVLAGIVLPIAFCGVGFYIVRLAYIHLKTARDKKIKCLSQTYGKIIGISTMKTNRGRAYFPTYEYMVDDEVIKVTIDFGTTYCQYHRGDKVKIWYDKNRPSFSYIDGYKEDTFAAVVGSTLGGIALFCGLLAGYLVWIV